MSRPTEPSRPVVIELLAEYGECSPEAVGDRIDSLQLAWLVHAVEEAYEVRLDLDDDQLEAMDTVDGAVHVLSEVWATRAPAVTETGNP